MSERRELKPIKEMDKADVLMELFEWELPKFGEKVA